MNLKNYVQRFLLVATAFLFIHLNAHSQTRTLKYNTPINSNINGYYEFLPANYATNTEKKYPLIIYLHGFGVTGNGLPGQLEYIVTSGWGTPPWRSYQNYLPSTFVVDGQSVEYILITPQFIVEPYYNGHSNTQDINDLIDYCIAHYRINEAKIYLTGQSGGANYVMNYVASSTTHGKRIAAVVAVTPGSDHGSPETSGSTPAKGQTIASSDIPVWVSVSEFDNIFPGDLTREKVDAQAWVDDINNATPAPTTGAYLYVLPGPTVHSHNDAAIATYDPATLVNGKNIYQWILGFERQAPVPVTGLTLTGKYLNKTIQLKWSTLSEKNNSGFKVERSLDGSTFNSIGFVNGKGSLFGSTYEFTDTKPLSGNNFYRIMQVDKDGKTSVSAVISVNAGTVGRVSVFPNPVMNKLTIRLQETIGAGNIRIYNSTGILCIDREIKNESAPVIDVSGLAKGYYNGQIVGNGQVIQFKFLKN